METMRQVNLIGLKELRFETVERPTPKAGEVLIKVHVCGVCGSDIHAYYGKHPYIPAPIVLGHEFAGDVAEVSSDVAGFMLGDRVTVLPHLGCGTCKACKDGKYNLCDGLKVIGCQAPGAFAEYVAAPAKVVFKLPDALSYEQGAFVEPAAVGYHGAKRGVKPDDTVLVSGAGPIGVFAMQAALALGASHVYACDFNKKRLGLASALGAHGVIDLAGESVTDGLIRLAGGSNCVDCFMDCVGADGNAMNEIFRIARRGASIVSIGVIANEYRIPNLPDITEHELNLFGSSMYWPEDFEEVIDLVGRGVISTDGLLSHRYGITEIHRMFDMVDRREEEFMKIMLAVDFA